MAAVTDRAGRHVAETSFHHAVPGRRKLRLPACGCGGEHVAQGGRPHAGAWAGSAQAAHRAQRHRAGGMAGRSGAAARRLGPPHCGAKGRRAQGGGLCRVARYAQCARCVAAGCRADADRTIQLRAGGRRPRKNRPATTGAGAGLAACGVFRPRSQGANSLVPGANRHRLHRLAARADLPVWHCAQQAHGLHDGALRGAAFGGSGQRPRG